MPQTIYDALIIGGGPGGSTVATYLARAGRRVMVIEKEQFPRFHIGESLLPYNHQLFREMGLLPALETMGFPRKFGAQFHLGNGSKSLKLVFRNGTFTRESVAFQVERALFDELLIRHAGTSGAEIRQGWTVTRTAIEGSAVVVEARGEDGRKETLRGKFLVDASGRANFTGNQEGLRVVHPKLKKLALFGHFEGVTRDEGAPGGDTVIVRLEDKWFWLIPVSENKTSVGCVMEQEEFSRARETPADLFDLLCQSSSAMRARMEHARPLSSIQATGDFSYYNRRLVGPRLLRVGDAAGFMDPIFSAGVYLAMYSGRLAARALTDALAEGEDGRQRFRQYEKRFFRSMRYFWEMVEAFYTRPFMELFLEPRHKFQLPDAIVAILAGELEGGWKLDWRRRLFFLLIKLHARWPLVPGVSFADPSPGNMPRHYTLNAGSADDVTSSGRS